METHNIVVIGASAGGVETLKQLFSLLPPIPAVIGVVLHLFPQGTSAMPTIISRVSKMPALHPVNGQVIEKGHIYIAPPNKHLVVKQNFLKVTNGPKENGHRPAVDVLFRTAARVYQKRVIGVVLSGALDDGTAGLRTIKLWGGTAVVQNPEEALYSGMPRSAIEHINVDHVLPIAEIAALLTELVKQPVEESEMNTDGFPDDSELELFGEGKKPSQLVCPDCGGSMWEVHAGELVRYTCHVGHSYSPESLLSSQTEAVEDALWVALRTLEENVELNLRMAERARKRDNSIMYSRYMAQVAEARMRADILRHALSHTSKSGDNRAGSE